MARDNLRCLPPTRTLRRIQWPLQPRFRDRPTAFGECDDHWTTLSRHPGSWPILHLITWMKADRQSIVSIDTVPEIFRPQTPRRLGPRSLVPPLFWERCVRAYSRPGCCLPTSATALTDVRATNPSSRFLAGTMAMTTFLFLRITPTSRPRVLPRGTRTVTRGEPRMRPDNRDPGAGSSLLRGFSRPRYLDRRATLLPNSLHRWRTA